MLDAAFFSLAQFIVGLPPQARVDILDQGTRRQISRAIDSQLQICHWRIGTPIMKFALFPRQ